MAGENRGKVLEALVRHSIEPLRGTRFPCNSEVVWDKPVAPLAWKPDIYIPPSSRFGGLLVLVTFAGSETDSRQKFWRNLAEFFDAKQKVPSISGVCVIAGARVREKQLQTQKHIFDAVFQFEDHAKPAELRRWLSLLALGSRTPDALLDGVAKLASAEQGFCKVCTVLTKAIGDGLACAPLLDPSFWQVRAPAARMPPTARNTHYRRGVSKAILFTSDEIAALRRGSALQRHPRHDALLEARILRKSLRGLVLVDEDVRFALQNVPDLSAVIDEGVTEVGRSSRDRLWDLGKLHTALEWCAQNWGLVGTPNRLESRLKAQQPKDGPPGHSVYQALKATLALRMGRQGQEWIEDVADRSGEMRSILVGLILPRFERGAAVLPLHVAQAVSISLARRCASVEPLSATEIKDAIKASISAEVEARLVCHGIDPVEVMLHRWLRRHSVGYEPGRLPSGLAERLGYSENDLGTRGILVAQRHFIHWKSASDDGRDHKVKELYARAFQGIRTWAGNHYKLRKRPERSILVVDGTWKQEDLIALVHAGWNAVLYPDQLDDLEDLLG